VDVPDISISNEFEPHQRPCNRARRPAWGGAFPRNVIGNAKGLARGLSPSVVSGQLSNGRHDATTRHPETEWSRISLRTGKITGKFENLRLFRHLKRFPDEFYENIYKLKGWVWPGMGKNRYSVVGHYTNNLVFERIASGLLKELHVRSPKNEKGNRPNKLHQWLTGDVGEPMLSQHLHSLIMLQRVAIAQGYGWQRFLQMVDQAMPRRGDALPLPFEVLDDEEGGQK
jgi:hypothetical protein